VCGRRGRRSRKNLAANSSWRLTWLCPASRPQRELREYLRQHLPDYMVPATFRFLDKFPLNANGQDRPAWSGGTGRAGGRAGSGAGGFQSDGRKTDRHLEGVLGCDSLGPTTISSRWAAISLLATLIVSRVREHFRSRCRCERFFESPPWPGLAEIVARIQLEVQEDEIARILGEIEGLTDEEARQLLQGE